MSVGINDLPSSLNNDERTEVLVSFQNLGTDIPGSEERSLEFRIRVIFVRIELFVEIVGF